jgi:hypothetical protein
VGDKENHKSSDKSQRLPALFAVKHKVGNADGKRVIKDEPGGLKADLVLGAIAAVLLLIPLETHMYLHIRTYRITVTSSPVNPR